MIRIMGNSVERVSLPDLRDVVYYKQTKEYTDTEHDQSRDLKREIEKGSLVVLERVPSHRAQASDGGNGSGGVTIRQDGVSLHDIKQAVREVLPEMKGGMSSSDLKDAMREIIPHIVDTVRQEMSSKLSGFSGGTGAVKSTIPTYIDPAYTPDIDTSGMKSNIKSEEKKVSGSDMESALAMLQNMNKQSK